MPAKPGQDWKWTEAEKELLRREWSRPISEIAAMLRKSRDAVKHKARALGLRRANYWTPAEDATLRESWGRVKSRLLAGIIGRTALAIKMRAMKLGLDAGRCYTAEEKDLVRRLYSSNTAAQLSERIHGTPHSASAIHRLAAALGLRKWPDRRELREPVRRLHAQGLNDREIADKLGLSRDVVHAIRLERLKLPANKEGVLRSLRRGVKTQMRTLGIKSPTELRTRAFRRYAAENGWPADLRPREVQILNVLAAKGPMTAREISTAIGMRTDRISSPRNGRRPLYLTGNGPGGTYTATLQRRGLIVYVHRAQKTGKRGYGRLPGYYMLSAEAIAIIERRRQHGTLSEAQRSA